MVGRIAAGSTPRASSALIALTQVAGVPADGAPTPAGAGSPGRVTGRFGALARAATVHLMTAPRSRHGEKRRWWRAPVLGRLPRRTARLALAGVAAVALGMGSAVGAAVEAVSTPSVAAPPADTTVLGPVRIDLPDEAGPWTAVPEDRFAPVRDSDALGGADIDGTWGVMAPGEALLTVLTAAEGSHGGLASVRESVPVGEVEWNGGRDHVVGEVTSEGVRVLLLAVVADDGRLVIVSLSAPTAAFGSGALEAAFTALRVD